MEENKILRINELAKKAKTQTLTSEEILEQKTLREEYIGLFRRNLKAQLDNISPKGDLVQKKDWQFQNLW